MNKHLPTAELQTAMTAYVNHVKADYAAWGNRINMDDRARTIREEMIREFDAKVSLEVGSKYVKVVTNGGAHSFIVIKADGKFAVGDILKAATWKAPATNFARGNVLTGDLSRVTWTGAA